MSVKVAFIGAGIIAHRRLEILARDPDVKVVGLCDVIKEKAEAAVRRFGGREYTDYRKMLDEAEPDAVFLCIPPFAHNGQEFDVIARRCAMFVEMPSTLDLGYGERVASAAAAAGIITACGYTWRYADSVEIAQDRLRDKPVGLVRGRWLGRLPISAWGRARDKSGGQIVEQSTHLFDIARYLVGDVRRVYARPATGFITGEPSYNSEDASVVSMEFDSGAVGEMTQTCMLDFEADSGLELISRRQAIEVTFDFARIRTAYKEETLTNRRSPLEVENEVFIEAVESADPSGIKSGYMDGLQSVAITLAANYSMESGEVVRL